MKSFFQKISKNNWAWIFCLSINIITLAFIYYKIRPQTKTLALHYNVLVGVDWYGGGKKIYQIPLIGFLILSANYLLDTKLKKTKIFLPYLTVFITAVIEVILLLAVLFLAKIN